MGTVSIVRVVSLFVCLFVCLLFRLGRPPNLLPYLSLTTRLWKTSPSAAWRWSQRTGPLRLSCFDTLSSRQLEIQLSLFLLTSAWDPATYIALSLFNISLISVFFTSSSLSLFTPCQLETQLSFMSAFEIHPSTWDLQLYLIMAYLSWMAGWTRKFLLLCLNSTTAL